LALVNPVLAEVFRKNIVESFHRGSAIVVDKNGEIVLRVGDVDRNIFPRSSLKLFQTIPLVETGAADHYGLSDKEIALACASHNAEPMHVETVLNWLERLGLDKEDLECGPDLPLLNKEAYRLLSANEKPTRVHQNCSGKHAGMLTLARFMNIETKGYSDHNHATQAAWMKALSALTGTDIHGLEWERDGCGLPAICIPMERLAFGFAQFANLDNMDENRAKAMNRILTAIRRHPKMIAGSERCCSAVISETQGSIIVKTGAEGVYGGVIPDMELGFVLKIDDGCKRGSEVALGGLLKKLGALSDLHYRNLTPYFEPDIRNSQGYITGKIIPGRGWWE